MSNDYAGVVVLEGNDEVAETSGSLDRPCSHFASPKIKI